jgi:hypothetical protein
VTFVELREEAQDLSEVWGYSNAPRAPDWFSLINQAYKDYCWATECVRGPYVDVATVSGTSEYTLTTPDWKIVNDVYYNGAALKRINEESLRRVNTDWLYAANGTPTGFWMPRKNVLRVYPPPNAVQTLRIWGVRGPTALSADADTPSIPDTYHSALPLRAAWLHARKYAKSPEQITSLGLRKQEYEEVVASHREDVLRQFGLDAGDQEGP